MPEEVKFGLNLTVPPAAGVRSAMVALDAEKRAGGDPSFLQFDDDYYPIVITASQILEAAGAEFVMSGFGNPRWPLKMSYDVSMIIEDLPDLLDDLAGGGPATLDMSAQGVAATLVFERSGDILSISCTDAAARWIDLDIVHHLPLETVRRMLNELANSFALARDYGSRGLQPATLRPLENTSMSDGKGGSQVMNRATLRRHRIPLLAAIVVVCAILGPSTSCWAMRKRRRLLR
ncbi:hypothetical protein [Actinomadura sp. 6N118]|uniref:hypothetical protein n=1 Tax=Actinomadura sp. 6N118 TaxID=3375151 RepID=UPI0037A06B43